MVVGRLLSSWEGNFSGAMLVSGSVAIKKNQELPERMTFKSQNHMFNPRIAMRSNVQILPIGIPNNQKILGFFLHPRKKNNSGNPYNLLSVQKLYQL